MGSAAGGSAGPAHAAGAASPKHSNLSEDGASTTSGEAGRDSHLLYSKEESFHIFLVLQFVAIMRMMGRKYLSCKNRGHLIQKPQG